jgi:hypothetical protein
LPDDYPAARRPVLTTGTHEFCCIRIRAVPGSQFGENAIETGALKHPSGCSGNFRDMRRRFFSSLKADRAIGLPYA